MNPSNKYRLIEISLDSYGIFWVNHYGDQASQGGVEFKYGQIGFSSQEDALSFIKRNLDEHLELFKNRIKETK